MGIFRDCRRIAFAAIIVLLVAPAAARAQTGTVTSAYTTFNADKYCKHRKGRDAEDYGSWLCAGYRGIGVRLSAGDQRMYVSFGPRAADEPAANETLPAFNDVYKGTIEWRIAAGGDGKPQPFATILRWNYMLDPDDRTARGRALVVTRLNPGGVCHVGYVKALSNADANQIARNLADTTARNFKCGADKAEWK